MEIKLNIKEDVELRNELKSLIQSQVKSLVREEIRSIATETLKEKFNHTLTPEVVQKLFKDEIDAQVKSYLGIKSWNNNFVRDEAKKMIAEIVRDLFKNGAVN